MSLREPGAEAPFFIVGNDRSGTTMLRLVLDRSREAALPPESMFLIDFEAVRQRGELADAARAAEFLTAVWSHPKVRLWGLPLRATAGAEWAIPRGRVSFLCRGPVPRLCGIAGERAFRGQDAGLPESRRSPSGGVARGPGDRARPRRPRCRPLDPAGALRAEQRVDGREMVGPGNQARPSRSSGGTPVRFSPSATKMSSPIRRRPLGRCASSSG